VAEKFLGYVPSAVRIACLSAKLVSIGAKAGRDAHHGSAEEEEKYRA